MTGTLRYDAGASRLIEATYTTADVVEQRRVVRQALALRRGDDRELLAVSAAYEVFVRGGPERVFGFLDEEMNRRRVQARIAQLTPGGVHGRTEMFEHVP